MNEDASLGWAVADVKVSGLRACASKERCRREWRSVGVAVARDSDEGSGKGRELKRTSLPPGFVSAGDE